MVGWKVLTLASALTCLLSILHIVVVVPSSSIDGDNRNGDANAEHDAESTTTTTTTTQQNIIHTQPVDNDVGNDDYFYQEDDDDDDEEEVAEEEDEDEEENDEGEEGEDEGDGDGDGDDEEEEGEEDGDGEEDEVAEGEDYGDDYALDEEELEELQRLEEYEARGYEWPIPEVVPNTPGWDKLMRTRMAQIEQLEHRDDRYNGFVPMMTMALVAPNFTEHGWGLTRAPEEFVSYLKKNLHEGLDKATEETENEVIDGYSDDWLPPLFIKQTSLNKLILQELQPMHEAWAGIPLKPKIAYGLRVYRNQSILHMHVDHSSSHIISCILHVDHDKDSEPWPLFIEDFQGNTNEVILESGDMLFYESSKCLHGRPRPFNGKWYSSVFVHYYPANDWKRSVRDKESHYAIPPHWVEQAEVDPKLNRLEMEGAGFTEPDCPDMWCNTLNTIKWYGPAEEGKIISTGDRKEGRNEVKDEL